MSVKIIQGDALTALKTLPDESTNFCVTSPPYWGLRDYGTAQWEGGNAECSHRVGGQVQDNKAPGAIVSGVRPGCNAFICATCGAKRIDQQIGLERTPDEYVAKMVEVFREVRRVLRGDGTLWLNLGDSYNANGREGHGARVGLKQSANRASANGSDSNRPTAPGLKPKDLVGIPWRVAFALQADGWYLRQDIIWCLSGGTWLYAKTQKGEMPIMVRDLARIDPNTVMLWNGEKWTQLLGMNRSHRNGEEIEIVLRSGERISCTPTHKFPTNRGLLPASEIKRDDIILSCQLPEPEKIKDCAVDEDAAWFAGLYIAEGSKSLDTIQIAGHAKETERLDRIQRIASKYGGSATHTIKSNLLNIRVYGKILNAIIDELVSGRTAKDKCFSTVVWRYSNKFIAAMVDGYLSGDGHWDRANKRWRLGFIRNYNLERDLRTACARLGHCLTLKLSTVKYQGTKRPTFRGELRKLRNGHFNQRYRSQVVEIRKARCREVYDLGVKDAPHLFALASGILTHNSKPNPMPESVRDRCTKSHEYIFLMSKSQRYYYDADAIKEPSLWPNGANSPESIKSPYGQGFTRKAPLILDRKELRSDIESRHRSSIQGGQSLQAEPNGTRNKRSVWTVATAPYSGAHFATFPPKLIEPCILAGCPVGGVVLDPFGGSGTVGMVSEQNGRNSILIELNPKYVDMAKRRTAQQGLFAGVAN